MQWNDWFGFAADIIGIVGAGIGVVTYIKVRTLSRRLKKDYKKKSLSFSDPAFLMISVGANANSFLDEMRADAEKRPGYNKDYSEEVQFNEDIVFYEPTGVTGFCSSQLTEIMEQVDLALNRLRKNGRHNVYLYYRGPSFVELRIGERLKNHFNVAAMHFDHGKYVNTGVSPDPVSLPDSST